MSTGVVRRDTELASVRGFVSSISEGAVALALEGEAGIGKTTPWQAGLDEAGDRALRILVARPAESETALSLSGIGDLLGTVLEEALAALPMGQNRALSRTSSRNAKDRRTWAKMPRRGHRARYPEWPRCCA